MVLVQINVNSASYTQYQVGHYGRFNITLLGLTYVDSTNTFALIQLQSNQLYQPVGTPYLLTSNSSNNRAVFSSAPVGDTFTWKDVQLAGYIDFSLNNLSNSEAASGLVLCLVDLDLQRIDDK